MRLSNFEALIDSTILQRGKDYFETGAVEHLQELDTGFWEAEVMGSEGYTVEIYLVDDTVTSHGCTCPYDWGPFCKHQVALLFALREHLSPSRSLKKARKSKPTMKEKITHILDAIDENEAKQYIQTLVNKDRKIRDHFLLAFSACLGDKPSVQMYKEMIKKIINNYSDYGYIDYQDARAVVDEICDLLGQGCQVLATNPEQSVVIARAVFEALPQLYEGMDDSDGGTGEIAHLASDLIADYIEIAPSVSVKELFSWFQSAFNNPAYTDYGNEGAIDALVYRFAERDEIAQDELLQLVDSRLDTSSEWSQQHYLQMKMGLLQSWGFEDQARDIMMQNLERAGFRKQLVREKVTAAAYDEAITLLEEGIQIAEEKNHPGTVADWRQELLSIAQQTENTEDIVKWAKVLFLDSRRDQLAYYQLLKQYAPDWPQMRKALLAQVEKDIHLLAQIYQEDEEHEALLKLLQQATANQKGFAFHTPLSLLHEYTDVLAGSYSAELVDMYQQSVEIMAKDTGRGVYHKVAQELKTMQKLSGGKERALQMLATFKEQYRNRPAMMEILNQHFA